MSYPDTSLALARRKADAARKLLAEGLYPSQQRKAEREAVVQERAVAERRAQGAAGVGHLRSGRPRVVRRAAGRLVEELRRQGDRAAGSGRFPYIGRVPAGDVTGPQLLEVMRRIEARGVIETAHRVLQDSGQVLRYAVATGHAKWNPARELKDALRQPNPRHFPAIVEPKRLGELLRAMDNYTATPVVRAALKLAPMLLLRPGELRFAEWPEIDLEAALWSVPATRMKRRELRQKMNGTPHLVPLPTQAVAVFRDLHALTGQGKMVFRGERHHDRAMSENTVNAALRAMGFSADEVTGHGFRATARTMLHERLGYSPDVIEAQLAHTVRDSLGRAYNRTEFVEQRREMLQTWADYLDQLRSGKETPLRKRKCQAAY